MDGSYVTDKEVPADIDIVVVCSRSCVPPYHRLLCLEYVHEKFRVHVFLAREGGAEYDEWVEFFARVRERPGRRKGLLRVGI